MRRELRRVGSVLVALFIALFVSSTIIQVVAAPQLNADSRNRRAVLASYDTQRGAILVNGEAIAQSKPIDSQYKFQRVYSNGPLYSAVTGYYSYTQGASGLESAENSELSGSSDSQFFRQFERLFTGESAKGNSIDTTINPKAQKAAWDALGNKKGAVIAIEPKTGKILAMVSKPTVDPNDYTGTDSAAVKKALDAANADTTHPLINRTINGALNPPGSTFKLVTTATALETGKYTPDNPLIPNPGQYTLPGTSTIITNAGEGQCGGAADVSMADALRLSCNIPFAQIGVSLGNKAIKDQAEKFGFNKSIKVPMSSQPAVYPTTENDAQTAMTAFGQFEDRANPLQMAMVACTVANGGKLMQPTLVNQVLDPNLKPVSSFTPEVFSTPISSNTASTMTQMMQNNVDNGVASNARMDGVEVAGKTGTAQNGARDPYTLWFTGFAPANDPKVAVAVVIQDGGGQGQSGTGNTLAAPVAQKVMEAVLSK